MVFLFNGSEYPVYLMPKYLRMNRRLFFAAIAGFIFFQLPFAAIAQKFSTSLSAAYPGSNSATKGLKMYGSGNELIAIEEVQKNFTATKPTTQYGIKLLKYDTSMKLVKETILFQDERFCGPGHASIQTINDKLWLFYPVQENKNKDVTNLMGAIIDPASLTIGEPKQLLQIQLDNAEVNKSVSEKSLYSSIISSPDKSKLLVFWSSNLGNKFFMAVLNANLDPVWRKTETVNSFGEVNANSACLDNDGKVYVGYRYGIEKNNIAGRVTVYQQKGSSRNLDIKVPGGRVRDVYVLSAKNGNVVYMAGTLANEEDDHLKAAFAQSVTTSSLTTGKLFSKEFPLELLELAKKGSWASTKKNGSGLNPLTMQPYELEDESIALVGQFQRSAYNYTKNLTEYLYGSILNIRLKDNDINFGLIPKSSIRNEYNLEDGYYAIPYKNKLLIFYNDEVKNIEKGVDERLSTSISNRGMVLAVASMDEKGMLRREKLLDLSDDHFMLVAAAITPLSSTSLSAPVVKVNTLIGIGKERKTGQINIQ